SRRRSTTHHTRGTPAYVRRTRARRDTSDIAAGADRTGSTAAGCGASLATPGGRFGGDLAQPCDHAGCLVLGEFAGRLHLTAGDFRGERPDLVLVGHAGLGERGAHLVGLLLCHRLGPLLRLLGRGGPGGLSVVVGVRGDA